MTSARDETHMLWQNQKNSVKLNAKPPNYERPATAKNLRRDNSSTNPIPMSVQRDGTEKNEKEL